MGGDAIVLKES